jgi:FdrA protein
MRRVVVRKGAYRDSVTLMQLTKELTDRDDVDRALVAMATELNLDLLVELGFTRPDESGPSDLVIAVETRTDAAIEAVLEIADLALSRQVSARPTGTGGEVPARTIGAAARRVTGRIALISTPGRLAAVDAADALDNDLDVMIFSDNVGVAEEVRLKDLAGTRGRLVMGPDCGTAVVSGVGLGFANVVRPGPVGIVAASGTGAQQMLALLDAADIGVTHCLGVGGRDLSERVAGRSTRSALDLLDADTSVELIVLLSKTPAPGVAREVAGHATALRTPCVLGYLGPDRPDLTATAQRAVEQLGRPWSTPARIGPEGPVSPGSLRGLFVGGTLCDEARVIAVAAGRDVASNLGGGPAAERAADGSERTGPAPGDVFVDFGADEFTSGRPHPMIDPSLRLQRLRVELADPGCAVVLLDVVLGHGAHPDPASDLEPLLRAATKPVVVTVVGTRDDPQGTGETMRRLADAGAIVHASNAAATREALTLARTS